MRVFLEIRRNYMPEFSVIIPVYKVEDYIARCINSVLEQTVRDFELILIDDGSPDKSGRICEEFATLDNRIRVVHQKNLGVSHARNIGIKMAMGKYVTFIDSDDEVENDYLASMMEANERTDLVICGVKHINSEGVLWCVTNCLSRIDDEMNTSNILYMYKNKMGDSVCSKRFKRTIIEKNKLYFDENINLGEDSCFLARYLCKCNTIEFVEKATYKYYKYPQKTLSYYDDTYVQKLEINNEKIESILEQYYVDITKNLVWKQRCFSIYYYAIFYVLRSKEYSDKEKYQSLKSILKMEKLQPYLAELDKYMSEDSRIIRKIIATKSALVILLFWEIMNRKHF